MRTKASGWLGIMVFSASLMACGGGSSSDTTDGISISSITYTPSAPTSGTPVAATASVSVSGSLTTGALSYVWTQTSGPAVTLSGTTAATVYFTAPTVTANSDIVLNLTVSEGSYSASKSVSITIAP